MAFDLPDPWDDGLRIDPVGPWSADKHHFLRRYIDAFTTSMKDKPWKGLHYIDLFAGPGILRMNDGRLDWGSPLIAAQAPNPFHRLHLCDLKAPQFNALSARLRQFPQPNPPQLIKDDANVAVKAIVATIPQGALSLAFLDPHGLHLHYSTLQEISKIRADLIVFFPDYLDVRRNWMRYAQQEGSNLDLVLGTTEWRSELAEVSDNRWFDALQEMYVRQIRKLGYKYFAEERIARPGGGFLYKLIFCCNHPRGEEIWRGIAKRKPGGQDSFGW